MRIKKKKEDEVELVLGVLYISSLITAHLTPKSRQSFRLASQGFVETGKLGSNPPAMLLPTTLLKIIHESNSYYMEQGARPLEETDDDSDIPSNELACFKGIKKNCLTFFSVFLTLKL